MPDDAAIKDFLNPKSMLTPGVAGGITMLIANTLWVQFGLQPRWTGLAISFAIGLLVFTAIEIVLWQRLVYWILNSLIIFSVGVGAHALSATPAPGVKIGGLLPPSSAYAQEIDRSKQESDSDRDRAGAKKLDPPKLRLGDKLFLVDKDGKVVAEIILRDAEVRWLNRAPDVKSPSKPARREDRSFFNGSWTFGGT